MPPQWVNRVLVWWLDVERFLLDHFNLPFGVSLIVVGRKPAKS
jgi:hypothetical protein